MKHTPNPRSHQTLNRLATLFLGLCLALAFALAIPLQQGQAVNAAEDYCETFNGVDDCQAAATNCLCEVCSGPGC